MGTIGIVDFDVVDFTNLQRQIIHNTADVGRKKLDSAADKLAAINPNVKVIRFDTHLSSANALDIVRDFDIVIDGTDNFPTRYLVNDVCVLTSKPNVYGSFLDLKDRSVSSALRQDRAIAACTPNRRRRDWFPRARRAGCSGFFRDWSASCRRRKRSS